MSNWSWLQSRAKHIGENMMIKYIISIEVHFVGYLYIMDLNNAMKLEKKKKKVQNSSL
jgi:hypothetical protein